MRQVLATASRLIHAPPKIVYGILADYRRGHPSILPRRGFLSLDVEEGGIGAGTVFRLRMKVIGVTRAMRARVTEPIPGQVLVETDESAGIRTTFDVRPDGTGQDARVTIRTQ